MGSGDISITPDASATSEAGKLARVATLRNRLGACLRALRGRRTQQETADALGVTRQTYIRYENGERTVDVIFLVEACLFFKVDPRWLLFGEGPSPFHRHDSTAPPSAHVG